MGRQVGTGRAGPLHLSRLSEPLQSEKTDPAWCVVWSDYTVVETLATQEIVRKKNKNPSVRQAPEPPFTHRLREVKGLAARGPAGLHKFQSSVLPGAGAILTRF